jgi:Ca2+-binding EF-hand superfamily protein
MGAFRSKPAPPPGPSEADFQKLANTTHFTNEELRLLFVKFTRFASTIVKDGTIDMEEFRLALGMNSPGFSNRIFAAFDRDDSRTIEFSEFAEGLSALSERAELDEKVKFCFRVYDIDANGSIEANELRDVVRMAIAELPDMKVEDDLLAGMVDAAYQKFDTNDDGKISLDEFRRGAHENPDIVSFVSVNIDKLLGKTS